MSEEQVANLVSALDRLSLAVERASQRDPEWEVVPPASEAAGSHPVTSLEDRQNSLAFGDYEGQAALLPPVPDHLLTLCRRLRGGDHSAEYRARRAWESGCWAGLVLRGKLAKPRSSLPLENLRVQHYIILRAKNISAPTRVDRPSDLFKITGKLDDWTICHGFPSLAEAEVYCAGAGQGLPDLHRWQ